MQTSSRVSRTKSNKKLFDDGFVPTKRKVRREERSTTDVRRDLDSYFERKRLKEMTDDVWV